MENQKAKISHWQIQKRSQKWCIVGEIVEHPHLTEGETVITTPLLYIDFKKMCAETKNTIYELI